MNPTRHASTTLLSAVALCGGTLLIGCGEASPSPDAAPIIDAGYDAAPDAAVPINPCQLLIDDEARPGHPFDVQRFEAELLPDLQASCGAAACHQGPGRAGGYSVWTDSNSACATIESFNAFYARTDFQGDVANSEILRYIDGSLPHPGAPIAPQIVDEIRAFIEAAHLQYTGSPDPGSACAPAAGFDLDVFEGEILPLLEGSVNYNDPEGGSVSTGCARSACHGNDRGPGTFYIDPARTPEENLDSFRCFVNAQNPAASQVLLCPLNLAGCQASPHPGADVFSGFDDLNYQKLLSYLLAARNGAQPLDFAFFVRKLNPMFNDENAVQDGLLGLTCASAGCHRAPIDNGVNFGIIPEATAPADVFLNYAEAVQFVYTPDASLSSLLMYSTNEVANLGNPAATGLDHPGGQCFNITDQESLAILEFAGGLRPDGNGFLRRVLVAGLFPATDVTDALPFDEVAVRPKIFDRSGQPLQFNQGQWDFYAASSENIDFLEALSVADAEENIAVGVAYVANTLARDLDVVISVESDNDVALLAGAPGAIEEGIGRDGAGVTRTIRLPPFASSQQLTRLLVKAFQKVGDAGLGFTMQFSDDNGNLLTDATRELVFTLGGQGGGL